LLRPRGWLESPRRIRHRPLPFGRPIAEKRATWAIGTDRLLAYVEKWRGGPSARAAAEPRLKEHWPQWSQAPELRADTKKRAAG